MVSLSQNNVIIFCKNVSTLWHYLRGYNFKTMSNMIRQVPLFWQLAYSYFPFYGLSCNMFLKILPILNVHLYGEECQTQLWQVFWCTLSLECSNDRLSFAVCCHMVQMFFFYPMHAHVCYLPNKNTSNMWPQPSLLIGHSFPWVEGRFLRMRIFQFYFIVHLSCSLLKK